MGDIQTEMKATVRELLGGLNVKINELLQRPLRNVFQNKRQLYSSDIFKKICDRNLFFVTLRRMYYTIQKSERPAIHG